MTISGSWRVYGSVDGLPQGSRAVDVSIAAVSTSVGDSSTTSYAVGFTAITPPAAATAALIIPPAGNTNAIKLKGITGDTGVSLHPTNPTVISFPAGSTFGLTISTGATIITIQYL